MKKRIAFMGGKRIGAECFRELLKRQEELNAAVVGAFPSGKNRLDGDVSVHALAREAGIPVFTHPDGLFGLLPVDILISVQYHLILKFDHLQRAREAAVNLHMAPLPEYRGCNQFSFAIMDGRKEFGTSLHLMTEDIDAGDLLFEQRFPIEEDVFVHELYNRTFEASRELFSRHLPDLIAGNYRPVPQQKLAEKRGSRLHYRHEIGPLKKIEAHWPREKQKRHFRATFFPGFEPPVLVEDGRETPLDMDWYRQS